MISAEDAFGNKGEKTILLRGERASSGEKLGEATIVIDMGVVGLGSSSITCDVLAGEPASCAVAKRSGAIRRRSHSERLNEASAGARSATIRSALIST